MRAWRRRCWQKKKLRWINTRFSSITFNDLSLFDAPNTFWNFLSQSKVGSPSNATNPFLSSPPASSGNIVDFFGAADQAAAPQQQTNALDDLLQLGNPFADMFGGAPAQQPPQQAPANQWMSNGRLKKSFSVLRPSLFDVLGLNFSCNSEFVENSCLSKRKPSDLSCLLQNYFRFINLFTHHDLIFSFVSKLPNLMRSSFLSSPTSLNDLSTTKPNIISRL